MSEKKMMIVNEVSRTSSRTSKAIPPIRLRPFNRLMGFQERSSTLRPSGAE